jgi:hypothetical protein
MKLPYHVKLGIFEILLFAVVISSFLLWTPLKIKYYRAMITRSDVESSAEGIDNLLSLGQKGRDALIEAYPDGARACGLVACVWNDVNKELNSRDIIAEYINENYDPSDSSLSGYTLLHFAARKNLVFTAKLLLFKGADPEMEAIIGSKDGLSQPGWIGLPMHVAAENGNLEMIKLLVDARANLKYKNLRGGGSVPEGVYECAKDDKTRRLIIQLGGKPSAVLTK